MNEATARAYVRVASALIDTRALYPHDNVQFKRAVAYLVITNTGRAAAKNLSVEYALLEPNPKAPSSRMDGAIGSAGHFREMVPSASETIRFGIPVLVTGRRLDLTDTQFSMNVTFAYNDGVHQADKVEQTMMCGNKPNAPEGGLVHLYYCVNFVGEYDQHGKPVKR